MNPLRLLGLVLFISIPAGLGSACAPSQEPPGPTTAPHEVISPAAQNAPTATGTPTPISSRLSSPTNTAMPPAAGTDSSFPTPSVAMEEFSVLTDTGLVRIDVPEGWKAQLYPPSIGGELVSEIPMDDALFAMVIEDLPSMGFAEASLEQFADFTVAFQERQSESFKLVSRQSGTTSQGLPVQLLSWTNGPGDARFTVCLVYIHDHRTGIIASYTVPSPDLDSWFPVIVTSLESLRVEDD